MTKLKKIKEFWDERADLYGKSQQATLGEIAVRHLEINEIDKYLSHKLKILDVGCGNGFTTRIFAKKYKSQIVGVDYSPKMISIANQSIKKNNFSGDIKFEVQNCLSLNFDNNLFDIVYTERCIQNLPELELQERAIEELIRVLKPGGKLILIECSKTGLLKLNKLRRMVGRKEISDAEPWHNKFVDDKWLFNFINKMENILKIEINHFASTYTYFTRILPFWRMFYYSRYFQYIPNIGSIGYFKAYIIIKKNI